MNVTGVWGVLRSPPWRHVPCGWSGAEGQQAARPREPMTPGMQPIHMFRDQHTGRGPEARPAIWGQRHGPPPTGGSSALGAGPCGRADSTQSPDGQEGPAGGRAGVRAGSGRGSSRQQSTHVLREGGSSWVRTDEEAGHVPPGLGGVKRELVDPLGAIAVHAGQDPPRQGTLPGASCASARPTPIPPSPHLNVRGAPSVSTALRVAPRQSAPCPSLTAV